MTFDELLAQIRDLLQREQRLSYRALKVRFHLDDNHLEALKEELIYDKRLAVDEDSRVLVWTGAADMAAATKRMPCASSATSPRIALPRTSTRLPPITARPLLSLRPSACARSRPTATAAWARCMPRW